MSLIEVKCQEYKSYIDVHRSYVKAAYNIYEKFFISFFNIPSSMRDDIAKQIECHDESKYDKAEFYAYRKYFFPTHEEANQKNEEVTHDFHKAWLHHIHENPHHPEHWQYYDNETRELVLIRMPYGYIVEMICDWLAMSKLDVSNMLKWYDEKGSKKKMHPDTKHIVERLLHELSL